MKSFSTINIQFKIRIIQRQIKNVSGVPEFQMCFIMWSVYDEEQTLSFKYNLPEIKKCMSLATFRRLNVPRVFLN